ncbi:MAG: GDP-mannose 4,6-dehydratase, partial [Parachlamydiales bacterium]
LAKLDLLLEEFQPEYIVNFAAQSEVGPSWENPHHWFQTNAVAVTKLAHLLKDKKFLKKYLHISSPEVYGTCEGLVKEGHPMNPSTPYAASKAAGDVSLFTYYKNFNFPLVMVRATNVYGACQQLFKIIPRSIINLKKGKTIELHGGGKAVKSYIHIRDISRGELLAMEKGKTGQIYHFSPARGIEVREVVKLICQKMGLDFETAVTMAPERLGQDKAYVIDSSKAREELGWSPEISLEEGIADTIRWAEENFSLIEQEPLQYMHKA